MSIVIEIKQDHRFLRERLPLDDGAIGTAIGKLDGDRTSLFTMTVSGNELFVGGGSGKYTVTTLMADGRSLALVGDAAASGEIRMIIGGSWIDQPVRYLVGADRVLRACQYFARDGQMDDRDRWEKP